MKYLTIILLALILSTISCEDPIEVELNEAESTLVVDAWIDALDRPQVIALTQSLPYFQNEFAPGVTDAEVIVTNATRGTDLVFEHQGNGRYIWTPSSEQMLGEVGDEFDLNITWNGSEYTASTSLNRSAEIDSIFVEFREDEPFSEDGFYAQFIARDPAGPGDVYWIKTYKNDTLRNKPLELNIAYDAGFDAGSRIDGIVFIFPIREFTNALDEVGAPIPYQAGEEVRVEIHSLSVDAFNFLENTRNQLNNSSNGIFALPITNSKSNIINQGGGNAPLGFFNVATITSAEKIIEE